MRLEERPVGLRAVEDDEGAGRCGFAAEAERCCEAAQRDRQRCDGCDQLRRLVPLLRRLSALDGCDAFAVVVDAVLDAGRAAVDLAEQVDLGAVLCPVVESEAGDENARDG